MCPFRKPGLSSDQLHVTLAILTAVSAEQRERVLTGHILLIMVDVQDVATVDL
jgi:hypothetical protein